MKNGNELESSEGRGGGKGEPPVPPNLSSLLGETRKIKYIVIIKHV
jgi:hypothetical protein